MACSLRRSTLFYRDFFNQFPKLARFILDNRDVGDNPALSKPEQMNGSAISVPGLARYKQFFGPDHWSLDTPAWRIIAINSMLVGSGLEEGQAQFDWIDRQLAGAGSRHISFSPINRCSSTSRRHQSKPTGLSIPAAGAGFAVSWRIPDSGSSLAVICPAALAPLRRDSTGMGIFGRLHDPRSAGSRDGWQPAGRAPRARPAERWPC